MLSPQDEIPQQLSITAVSSFFDEQGPRFIGDGLLG
jgi:hypothetical protein